VIYKGKKITLNVYLKIKGGNFIKFNLTFKKILIKYRESERIWKTQLGPWPPLPLFPPAFAYKLT
jgi:hypothetical protein